jgi:hypothetical protein
MSGRFPGPALIQKGSTKCTRVRTVFRSTEARYDSLLWDSCKQAYQCMCPFATAGRWACFPGSASFFGSRPCCICVPSSPTFSSAETCFVNVIAVDASILSRYGCLILASLGVSPRLFGLQDPSNAHALQWCCVYFYSSDNENEEEAEADRSVLAGGDSDSEVDISVATLVTSEAATTAPSAPPSSV